MDLAFAISSLPGSLIDEESCSHLRIIWKSMGKVLVLSESAQEVLSDNAVRVRFLASPINPSDLNQIEGSYPVKPAKLPAVGGNEGVARVEEIGGSVSDLKVGDLVVPATTALGCWSDFACLNAKDLMKIPEKWSKSLPVEVLATINVNPPTAYRLLKDFVQLNRGDLIVQNGANSAVGRLVIQMASMMGARTLNIIRDRPDFDAVATELRQLDPKEGGATVMKAEDLKETRGIDAKLGLNCVGGGAVADMCKAIGSDGVIVTYGAMSRRPLTVPAAPLIFQNLSMKGFWLTAWYNKTRPDSPERSKMLQDILSWYSEGKLKPTRSFHIDINSDENEQRIKEFIKDSCEGKIMDKGKCILRFN